MREEEGRIEKLSGRAQAPDEPARGRVCPETGRRRRLTSGLLGPPLGGPVERDCRVPAAESAAFIQDAGKRRASIPHGQRPGHADSVVRGVCPANPKPTPPRRPGGSMSALYWVGIDVAL